MSVIPLTCSQPLTKQLHKNIVLTFMYAIVASLKNHDTLENARIIECNFCPLRAEHCISSERCAIIRIRHTVAVQVQSTANHQGDIEYHGAGCPCIIKPQKTSPFAAIQAEGRDKSRHNGQDIVDDFKDALTATKPLKLTSLSPCV